MLVFAEMSSYYVSGLTCWQCLIDGSVESDQVCGRSLAGRGKSPVDYAGIGCYGVM